MASYGPGLVFRIGVWLIEAVATRHRTEHNAAMRYLVGLLVAACTACGAPPLEMERVAGDTHEPAPVAAETEPAVNAVWLDIQDAALLVQAEDAMAWFHDVTGIPEPPVQIGSCAGDLFRTVCIRLGDPGDHPKVEPLGGSRILYSTTIDPNIADRGVSVAHVFRHEYAHHWTWPNLGVDGAGHSDTLSLMHAVTKDSDSVQCHGFTPAELDAICDHHACGETIAECE